MNLISLEAIKAAQKTIAGKVVRTPLLQLRGESVFLKAESLQPTGAFKLRGAVNFIAQLSAEGKARGVVADSSGNHAQAVAYAAKAVGAKATIVMPENAPKIKVEATRYFGAEIVFTGNSSDLLTQKQKNSFEKKVMSMLLRLTIYASLRVQARLAWRFSRICPMLKR
jgi:threonine dehydratase